MHESYADIIERIKDPPSWWDEHAVPRYEKFRPNMAANIYADYVVLMGIACQGCGHRFKVAMSSGKYDYILYGRKEPYDMLEDAKKGNLHYGDPPNYGCCWAGPTMNSVPLKILEFWQRGTGKTFMRWDRVTELDNKDLTPDWADDWEDPSGSNHEHRHDRSLM